MDPIAGEQSAASRRSAGNARPADIAIVGMSAILPGAPDLRRFWENVLDKAAAIEEVPAARWPADRYYDPDPASPDKIASKWGGFLPDVPFDPTRYGIPPASMAAIDPAQILGLVAAEAALADAGLLDMAEALRRRTAVILGFTGGLGDVGIQYAARAELGRALPGPAPKATLDVLPEWTSDSFSGLLPNVIAGRIANRFDFGGSSFVVDAACASSLLALRQAVMELEAGRCDVALCGAVETGQGPFAFMCFSKAQALSPTGTCRAFDAEANGTAISEGVGMLVLRRLEDAVAEGARIYAVIKGIDGSSDGRGRSMMAPLPEGQTRALRRAYEQAGYSAAEVDLFEAHGTGTMAGDAAEVESLSTLLAEAGAQPRQAALGSVKPLIGHAKGAAGLAGLMKVTLGLHHKVLPPHSGVATPNPALREPGCPLALHQRPLPWLSKGRPRRAGVSAFGFGGANYHVTLEEYAQAPAEAPRDRWPAELFAWRSADRAGLIAAAQAALEPAPISLAGLSRDLIGALGEGRATLALVASTPDQFQTLLRQSLETLADPSAKRPLPPGAYFSDAPLATDGKVALLFSGQGSQYPDMGRELALLFPEVGEILSQADAVASDLPTYAKPGAEQLARRIYPPDGFGEAEEAAAAKALAATDVAQPALGAIEAAMFALTRRFGIAASMVAGHSYGEYAALHAAGVLDRADLIRVSEARGRCIVDAVAGGDLGTMAAISADPATVREGIAAQGPGILVLANINAADQIVVSGTREMVGRAVDWFSARGIDARPIPVSAAFHSPLMQAAQGPLVAAFDMLRWSVPTLPVFSNTTGEAHATEPTAIRDLLGRHLTEPVDFVHMIKSMYTSGARLFLEVGPKSVLTSLTRRILRNRPHGAVALDGAGGGLPGLLHALAALLVQGVRLDLSRLHEGRTPDPAPVTAHSASTWLVNGTRARRPQDRPITAAPITAVPPPAATPAPARVATAPRVTKESPMHGFSGPAPFEESGEPAGGVERALVEHYRTMQQFLQTQERIMMAYLAGAPAAPVERPARPFSTPRPVVAAAPRVAAPAPRVARPAAPAPTVPAAPAPAPAVSAPAVPAPVTPDPAPAASAQAAAGLDSQALLLKIASERTGYPEDMLGLDLNMEADLGIDSIKRVEILAAFRKSFPQDVSDFLQPRMSKIAKSASLREILSGVDAALAETNGAARPFDDNGEEKSAAALARYILRPAAEDLPTGGAEPLPEGRYILVPDSGGVAEALGAMLSAQGAMVRAVPDAPLRDPDGLAAWVTSLRAEGRIAGIIALNGIGMRVPTALADWRSGMEACVKSLFPLLRAAAPDLERGGRVLVASGMGGLFGRDPSRHTPVFAGSGGAVGLIKCLAMEWPDCCCKAVDLDPLESAERMATHLLTEVATTRGRRETGYPAGVRTIFRTEPAPLDRSGPALATPDKDWVVLAIGGARGITAETARPFAAAGATLVLAGRSALPGPEDAALRGLADTPALRGHFLREAAASGQRPTPAQIEARIATVLRDREIRANLADFTAMGARIDDRVCDMRAPEDVASMVAALYARYGRIDAVLYGAGIIEDKLIVDKTYDSLCRVFDTKVDGAFTLAATLRPDTLKFFALFTSVAGRYGNRGQTDYGAANEVLNRYAWQLQATFGAGTKVTAVNWGAWARTTNGPGMLTPETARQFRERGLKLIEPADGRDVLFDELRYAPRDEVEIVAGEHDWDEMEDRAAGNPDNTLFAAAGA